jgi:hypothetical protein
VAPYERDSSRWTRLGWRNPYRPSDGPYRLATDKDVGHLHPADTLTVKSYGDLLQEYATHPEPKASDGNGHACQRSTRGALNRRRTVIAELRQIGKEAHRLDEAQTGLVGGSSEITSEISDAADDQLLALALAVLEPESTRALARQLPISARRLQDVRARRATPHHQVRQALISVASSRACLRQVEPATEATVPRDQASQMAAYLTNCGRGSA